MFCFRISLAIARASRGLCFHIHTKCQAAAPAKRGVPHICPVLADAREHEATPASTPGFASVNNPRVPHPGRRGPRQGGTGNSQLGTGDSQLGTGDSQPGTRDCSLTTESPRVPHICPVLADVGYHHLRFLAFALMAALCLPLTACQHTPTYSGPPNLVLRVLMKKWAIVPDRIVVPQNAHVELIVTTADVEHGLAVPGLAINEPVQPGRTTVIRFLAVKPGAYPMHCSILCGRGHDQMIGSIVIEPNPALSPLPKP